MSSFLCCIVKSGHQLQHIELFTIAYNSSNQFSIRPRLKENQQLPSKTTVVLCLNSTVVKFLGLEDDEEICDHLNFNFVNQKFDDASTLSWDYSNRKIDFETNGKCHEFIATFNSLGHYCLEPRTTDFSLVSNAENLEKFVNYLSQLCFEIIPQFLYYNRARIVEIETDIWQRSLLNRNRSEILDEINKKVFEPVATGITYETIDGNDDSSIASSSNDASNKKSQSLLARISSRCPSCNDEAIEQIVSTNKAADPEHPTEQIQYAPLPWTDESKKDGRIFSINIANRHLMKPLPLSQTLYLIQEIANILLPHLSSQDLILTVLPRRSRNTEESNQLLPNTAERIGAIYATNELFSDTFNQDVKPKARLKMPYQLSFHDETSKSIATFGYFGKIVFKTTKSSLLSLTSETTGSSNSWLNAAKRMLLGDADELSNPIDETSSTTTKVASPKKAAAVAKSSKRNPYRVKNTKDGATDAVEEEAKLEDLNFEEIPLTNVTKANNSSVEDQTQSRLLDLVALLADVMIVVDTNLKINNQSDSNGMYEIILPPFIDRVKSATNKNDFKTKQIVLIAPNFDKEIKKSVKSPLTNVHLFSKGKCVYMY